MDAAMGSGAPFFYDFQNAYASYRSPNTVHSQNTGLSLFFQKILLQRAMSNFKFTMPKHWAKNYFLYCLYCWGFVSVINTNRFGVIPQGCSLKGYNVMYQPNKAVISNPLFDKIYDLTIGTECALIRLQPDYSGVMDLVTTYADLMAMTMETAGVNIIASKLSYIIGAENKAVSESFKGLFDRVMSGEPAVVVDKQLLTEDGKPTWSTFTNNLKGNYIAGELLQDLQEWVRQFDSEIGIPHTNSLKRERLVAGEVNGNAAESYSKADLWLETIWEGLDDANRLFGLDLAVEWRVNPMDLVKKEGEVDVDKS